MNGWFSPLLGDSSSEPALNADTASGVAQLTDHLTVTALYIKDIIIDPTSPQLAVAQMQ